MYILKNAFISISRNKGRNILIGIIILVIACACTVTLAINNTAGDLIDSYESAYEKELTISFNRTNMMQDFDFSDSSSLDDALEAFDNIESYTIADIEEYATADHIESYYYTYSISLNGSNIDPASTDSSDDSSSSFNFPGGNNSFEENQLDFTLTGYSSIDSMSEFIDGTYTIVEIEDDAWDKAFDGNYVFINEELASYNDLALGDTIKLEDEDGNVFEFEIIGIFQDNDSDTMSIFSSSVNTIITNATALTSITEEYEDIVGTVNATFIIDDYANADIVQEQFYEKGLDENYVVETNEELANSGLSGVENVKSFATTFLIITLIIGSIVLIVINMINIRERKYEIGVLRTIGVSKFKLTLQFVAELTMVALVSLMIGAGIGACVSKPVSNSLLASEIDSTNTKTEDISQNFGGGDFDFTSMSNIGNTPSVSAYDSIDAVVNIQVILELLVIGLSLVLVSSISAMVSIQRFSPLTILKERS